MRKLINLIVCVLMIGCVAHKTTTSVQSGKYSEDLSVVRPKVVSVADTSTSKSINNNERKETAYVEPKHAINQQLDNVLDSISSINLTQKYVEGFTIQIYSGSKRE